MKKARNKKAVCVGGLALAFLSSVALADAPDPGSVHVNNITWAGSGCPAGTVASDVSEDAQAFTLLFSNYVAEAGPGIPLSAGRKACNLLINLHVPAGWSYSIIDVDYRGYAKLDYGTVGEQLSEYYFSGRQGPTLSTTIRGPFDDDYLINDRLGISETVWSPCGANRALNIKTQVRVSASGSRRALITTDSIDGELRTLYRYGLVWHRC